MINTKSDSLSENVGFKKAIPILPNPKEKTKRKYCIIGHYGYSSSDYERNKASWRSKAFKYYNKVIIEGKITHAEKPDHPSVKYRVMVNTGYFLNKTVSNFLKSCRYEENTNNNANGDDSRNCNANKGNNLIGFSKSSVAQREDVQIFRKKELKNQLVELIKEHDRMLEQLDFVDKMEKRAIGSMRNACGEKTYWKMEMKSVDKKYKMKVEGIVNNLKTSMEKAEICHAAALRTKLKTGTNNNADDKQEGKSLGFFKNLFKKSSRRNEVENYVPSAVNIRSLFRRTRGFQNKVNSNPCDNVDEKNEEKHTLLKEEMHNEIAESLSKLKRIHRNMLKDIKESSDVDFFLEEAKLLSGFSEEMETAAREEILNIETKFRSKFEKKMKKILPEKDCKYFQKTANKDFQEKQMSGGACAVDDGELEWAQSKQKFKRI
ncbi:uncharacterized protein LOC133181383 [Saccostrea echinata]|uniref:uncharacterized protein LOC133181383 n=1 Tax=Saccostrea echinata TaxID=191078 RepID=UPI002A83D7D1|nr:uncharacterized protein LOC133181383 [Saccostrea echinata]